MLAQHPPELADVLRDVVPVVLALTRPGEVESVSVHFEEQPRGGALLLEITLVGEQFRWFAWTPGQRSESSRERQDRLASELQDFIAESRFGWGELRGS